MSGEEMGTSRYTPVVIGVGDIKNRSVKVEDAVEPVELMLQAVLRAIQDTEITAAKAKELQRSIDHVGVVNTWTWRYHDLPGLLSRKLGVEPKHTVLSHHGGDSPAKLFDEAARRISLGQSKVAVVAGGEALASLGACATANQLPPPGWSDPDDSVTAVDVSDISKRGDNVGTLHSIGLPIHIYPLYENGLRAHRGQSIRENGIESAKLYAEFARVAEKNALAWNYGQPAADEDQIRTVSVKNRMICFPYPLLMNAFNNVNLAGSCLLTSTEFAQQLGVPKSRWIYPLGGAGTSDKSRFWERPNFHSSPSISRSLDAGLNVSGLDKDDIDLYDFYSCFPIVPKIACMHLKLPILKAPKPITLLGGLTSFGGAGNNYSMHALTEMVRSLRASKGANGLVLANGGFLTYQYVVCLSTKPRETPYPEENPLPDLLDDETVPDFDEQAEGEAVIETYTVEYSRDGSPSRGHIVGRLASGHRFLANHGSEATLRELAGVAKEPVGRSGWVSAGEDGRNLFTFSQEGRL